MHSDEHPIPVEGGMRDDGTTALLLSHSILVPKHALCPMICAWRQKPFTENVLANHGTVRDHLGTLHLRLVTICLPDLPNQARLRPAKSRKWAEQGRRMNKEQKQVSHAVSRTMPTRQTRTCFVFPLL